MNENPDIPCPNHEPNCERYFNQRQHIITAQKEKTENPNIPCPEHEPNCERYFNQRQHIITAQKEKTENPNIPCPEHEPNCERYFNQRQHIITAQREESPSFPCPEHEPLCERKANQKQGIVRSLLQKTEDPNVPCPEHEPLCERYYNQRVNIVRSLGQKSEDPNIPCPEHEPNCERYYNQRQHIVRSLGQKNENPDIPCPNHEPNCERYYNQRQHITTLASAAPVKAEPCEYLEITAQNLAVEMDYFSRRLNKKHYDNAVKIYTELQKSGQNVQFPKISTWELYDRAFTFPKVRNYAQVSENMNQLEAFEDNANLNLNNSHAIDKFIQSALQVRADLIAKYAEAFQDPAKVDPQADKVKTWTQ